MNNPSNRRDFLKTLGLASAGLTAAGAAVTSAGAADIKITGGSSRMRPSRARYMGGFAAPKLETVRWGAIGVGARGSGHVTQLSQIEGSEVVAIADLYEDLAKKSATAITKLGKKTPDLYYGSPSKKRGRFLVLTTHCRAGILPGMARKLRVEYPGAIYHVMNRGDRREEIFKDDQDRERFLETLGEVCVKTGWEVQALCLMGNHFHLVVETPQGNLVAGMKWFLGTYTARFNRRHKLFGHLFSGRYKALIVDGSGNGYLKTVCDYVHLNPARARLLQPEQALAAYRWSSWPEYLKAPGKRWSWLRVGRLLGEYRIPQDSAAGRRVLEQALEERRESEAGGDYKAIRRGWCLGEAMFRKELLAQMTERMGAEHYGEERLASDVEKAERIVVEELKARRWKEGDLSKRAKGDLGKVKMAGRLRAETLVTVKWIAERLGMGTAGYVNNRLYRWRKGMLK